MSLYQCQKEVLGAIQVFLVSSNQHVHIMHSFEQNTHLAFLEDPTPQKLSRNLLEQLPHYLYNKTEVKALLFVTNGVINTMFIYPLRQTPTLDTYRLFLNKE